MKHLRLSYLPMAIVLAAFLITACEPADDDDSGSEEPTVTNAVAVLHPTAGNQVTGIVYFSATAQGVQITADLDGLTPGDHGFHIHALGDCSAPDATSAGGHFNPDGTPHAGPDAAQRHVGDLGNITADSAGHAHYERTDTVIALGEAHSIVGRAVVVHGGADDFTSQPSGAAGPRVACGVVGIAR